jgi:PAS domain S-box-containing protein
MNESTRGAVIAIAVTGIVGLLRWLVHPILHDDSPFLVFTLSVAITALSAGFYPGLLATGLGAFLGALLFLSPRFSLTLTPSGTVQLLIFLTTGLMFSLMARAQRTARRAAEESEQYLTRIIETTVSGILVLDRNGYITFANAAAAGLFGLMPSHLIGRRYDDAGWGAATHEGRPLDPSEQPAARVFASGEGVSGARLAIRSADNTLVPLQVNAAALRDDQGLVSGVVLSLNRTSGPELTP